MGRKRRSSAAARKAARTRRGASARGVDTFESARLMGLYRRQPTMEQSRPEEREHTRAGTEVSYSHVPHAARDRIG
jgi:hypothetical protein